MGVRDDLTESGTTPPPVFRRAELLQKINSLDTNNSLRDRALIAFLYLTGARIEEVVQFKRARNINRMKTRILPNGHKIKEQRPRFITELKGYPIQKKQIEFRDNDIIVHDVRCLKQKRKRYRNIPIVFKHQEMEFVHIFLSYVATLKPDDFLWNFTSRYARMLCNEIGLYPHLLRHIRNSHLAIDYNFNSEELKKFNGWTRADTASNYVHLNVSDLISKMKKV